MKVTFITALLCLSFFIAKTQPIPAVRVANKIADKMKDSLGLSQEQRQQVFAINIRLFNYKAEARKRYQNRDSVEIAMQHIENRRDSLYRSLLTEHQLNLYKQKKRVLISNN
jgi:hypothetical protein